MEPEQTNIERLYNAALEGNTSSVSTLRNLLQEDEHILDRCMIEISSAYTQSPLHVASAKGHLPIVETLVDAKPQMCFAYDRHGMTPVHVAVVNGHMEVLQQVFLQKQPLAVMEPTTRGETVLHLCVKTNQPNVLKSLLGIPDELINSPHSNANTVSSPAMAPQDTQMQTINITPDHPETGSVMIQQRQNNNGGDSLARNSAKNRSMCLVRDQNGRTPIHVAAALGQVKVVEVLHHANRYAAQERTNDGESMLHVCVKYNQLQALKILIELNKDDGDQLINSKDNNGNTILHLAVTNKQPEMVRYIVEECKSSIEINALNSKDMTAVDVYKKQSKKDLGNREIKKHLTQAKAKPAKDALDDQAERLEKQQNALMVVASLVATMSFQVGINPPGGVWQEFKKNNPVNDSLKQDTIPGTAIWSYYGDESYNRVMMFSALGFLSSMSVIILLISGLPLKRGLIIFILRATLSFSLMATTATYIDSVDSVTGGTYKDVASTLRTAHFGFIAWTCLTLAIWFGHLWYPIMEAIKWHWWESIARFCRRFWNQQEARPAN